MIRSDQPKRVHLLSCLNIMIINCLAGAHISHLLQAPEFLGSRIWTPPQCRGVSWSPRWCESSSPVRVSPACWRWRPSWTWRSSWAASTPPPLPGRGHWTEEVIYIIYIMIYHILYIYDIMSQLSRGRTNRGKCRKMYELQTDWKTWKTCIFGKSFPPGMAGVVGRYCKYILASETKVNGDMETLSCGIPYEHSASDSVCGAPAAPQTPPAGRKRGWQSPRRACHLDRQNYFWISDRTMYNLFDEAYPTPPTIRNFTMGKRKKQK